MNAKPGSLGSFQKNLGVTAEGFFENLGRIAYVEPKLWNVLR